eukprot:1310381-Rhodomonas_salina.8
MPSPRPSPPRTAPSTCASSAFHIPSSLLLPPPHLCEALARRRKEVRGHVRRAVCAVEVVVVPADAHAPLSAPTVASHWMLSSSVS